MNNELMQTIINGILKDIRDLKDEVKLLKNTGNPGKKSYDGIDPKRKATEAQIIAVEKMGGETWAGMTHQDISDQFNEIRNKKIQEPTIDSASDLESEKGGQTHGE